MPAPPLLRRVADRVLAPMARRPVLSAALLAMWMVSLVPIWAPRFLPLLDLPNHLDAINLWHHFHDPEWGFQRYYRLNLLPLPYWGYFFPVHMLAYLMPVEVANKVYLSAYALALPLGAMLLAARTGRSPWLALTVFPLVFNYNFQMGFITFCAGMTLMLYAFVALDRFLEAPTRGGALALFLLTTFLYTTHVLPWLFFGVAALPWLFFHGLHPRRMLAASALMLPSVALGAFAFHAAQGVTHVQAGPLHFAAKWEQPTVSLEQAIHRAVCVWPGSKPVYFILGFALVWLLLMTSARPNLPDVDRPEPRGFPYRIEFLVALAGLAVLRLPSHLLKPVDLWMIGGRFVAVAALFLLLLPRGPLTGRGSGARSLLLLVACVLNAVYVGNLTRAWRTFDRRAAPVRRLMRQVPYGSSTLTLTLGDLTDPAIDLQAVPYVQFHAYPQFFSGGFDPWALNTGFPMVALPDAKLPSPRWKHPRNFRFDEHGIYYDYILTRGEAYAHQLFGPDDAGSAPMVGQDGPWRLYHVLNPVPPPKGRAPQPFEVFSPAVDPDHEPSEPAAPPARPQPAR